MKSLPKNYTKYNKSQNPLQCDSFMILYMYFILFIFSIAYFGHVKNPEYHEIHVKFMMLLLVFSKWFSCHAYKKDNSALWCIKTVNVLPYKNNQLSFSDLLKRNMHVFFIYCIVIKQFHWSLETMDVIKFLIIQYIPA